MDANSLVLLHQAVSGRRTARHLSLREADLSKATLDALRADGLDLCGADLREHR